MKKLGIIAMLCVLSACTDETQPIVMQVDNYTKVHMTSDTIFYETQMINLTTHDTITVTMPSEIYQQYSKKKPKLKLVFAQ